MMKRPNSDDPVIAAPYRCQMGLAPVTADHQNGGDPSYSPPAAGDWRRRRKTLAKLKVAPADTTRQAATQRA